MPDRNLSCPNCGAPLEAGAQDSAVICSFCGSDIRITSDGRPIPFFDRDAQPPPTDSLDEVRRLARSGRKIEAVKRYREMMDTSLAEAKAAVEAYERGEEPAPWRAPPADRSGARVNWPELIKMAKSGQKQEAARRYSELTGASSEESLQMMDRLEAGSRPGLSLPGFGCARLVLGTVLFFFLIFAGCGQFVRTTDMHACVVELVSSDRTIRAALGSPVEDTPVVFILGYNSESDFGGRTEQSAGYFMLVDGPQGRALLFVDAYQGSTGFYAIEVKPVPNPNDFALRSTGDIAECVSEP